MTVAHSALPFEIRCWTWGNVLAATAAAIVGAFA